MTIFDLKCDQCGTAVGVPSDGQRLIYHPGDKAFADNSSMLCSSCWDETSAWLGELTLDTCAVCSASEVPMLCVQSTEGEGWRLCKRHTVEFLNGLLTVTPKLDLDTFAWPLSVETERPTPEHDLDSENTPPP